MPGLGNDRLMIEGDKQWDDRGEGCWLMDEKGSTVQLGPVADRRSDVAVYNTPFRACPSLRRTPI